MKKTMIKNLLKDLGSSTVKVNWQNGTSVSGPACEIVNNPIVTDRDWLFSMRTVDGVLNFYARND